MTRTHGFTLIELLVVIALLGIIIAAVLVNMNSAKRKAYDTVAMSCAQDIARKEKIVQTRFEVYKTFDLLPDTTVCRTLIAMDATPTGNAEDLHFAYEVRHPRGTTTYTVTDSEIYENGASKTGALLTNDPAAPLVLAGGGGPIDPGGPGGVASLEACVLQAGGGIGRFVQGTLDSGGVTVTEGADDGSGGVRTIRIIRVTRLSHNVTAEHVTQSLSGADNYAVSAFLTRYGGANATEQVPTMPSASAINIPSLGVLTAAQWETQVMTDIGMTTPPDPGTDRAQNYLTAMYGNGDPTGHCHNNEVN